MLTPRLPAGLDFSGPRNGQAREREVRKESQGHALRQAGQPKADTRHFHSSTAVERDGYRTNLSTNEDFFDGFTFII